MNIKITNQKGVVLKTKDKLCEEDIVVVPDESILGDEINLQDKTITVNGSITADEGYDGLGTVTVAVPDTTPDLQDKTVIPTSSQQIIMADEGYDGLGTVTVKWVSLQHGYIDPSGSTQTIYPTTGYTGFSEVTVNAVTSSIDSNIQPSNIRKGVTILGVTGTYEGESGTIYEVTIHNTNNGITVYDGQSTTGSGVSIEYNETAVVNCTTGYLYIEGGVSYHPVSVSNNSGVTYDSGGDGWALLKITADGSCSVENLCIVEGTLITLADGNTKPIEDITYDDKLLTWNFDEGKYENRKPCWIAQSGTSPKYWHTILSDGTEIDLVGAKHNSHRFFNAERGAFIYANNFDFGNEHVFKQDSSTPVVVSCEPMTDKTVRFYNMMTEHNINFFANGILVGNRFSNMYPIEDMKFVKYDKPLNKREDYPEVPDRIFYGLRIAEQSEEQNGNGSVQFYDTLREHILHNIVEHEITYTGEQDYVPWKFKRKSVEV